MISIAHGYPSEKLNSIAHTIWVCTLKIMNSFSKWTVTLVRPVHVDLCRAKTANLRNLKGGHYQTL